jgi:hypothetical protein
MGVRTRGLDMAIAAKRQVADAAARAEAVALVAAIRRAILEDDVLALDSPWRLSAPFFSRGLFSHS